MKDVGLLRGILAVAEYPEAGEGIEQKTKNQQIFGKLYQ